MIKRIHVSQVNIRANLKNNTRLPVFTVVTSKWTRKGHSVEVLGPCEFVYSPDKPLGCGARLWASTHSAIRIDGEEIA